MNEQRDERERRRPDGDQPDRDAVRKRVAIKRIVTGAVAGGISVVTLAVGVRKRR